jgi:CheY-like chemotaxis protein
VKRFWSALVLASTSDGCADQEHDAAPGLAGVAIALHCRDPLWRRYLREQLEAGGASVADIDIETHAHSTAIASCDTLLIACQNDEEESCLPLLTGYPRPRRVLLTPLGPVPPEAQGDCIRVSALSQRSLLLAVDPAFDIREAPACDTLAIRDGEAKNSLIPLDPSLESHARSLIRDTTRAPARNSAFAKILLVEDDLVNVTLAQQQLRILGYADIELASNGREALEKCRRQTYGLVLTDQFMPEMDGNRLAAALRQQAYPAVIIMMTASRPAPTDRKNLDAVLLKPVSLEQLRTALSSHCLTSQAAATSPSAGKKMLWDAFFQDYAGTMETFDTAMENQDLAQCLRQLHKLKGALEILRHPLAKQVAALERRSKAAPFAELADEYRALRQALNKLADGKY